MSAMHLSTDTPPTRQGLLLFAHGAREQAWARPFEAVAAQLRRHRPGEPVAVAYLELMQPDLSSAADSLVQSGCLRVHVLPMFLGAGAHLRRDLPLLVQQLQQRHPQVSWTLHGALGEQPLVIDALARAALNLTE